MGFYVELVIAVLLVISGIFGLVGSFGLVKLRGCLRRLHGPTKATTLGVGSVLIASMVFFWTETGAPSIHQLMISLFLFLTAPITANFIAKTFLTRNIREDELPRSGRDYGWAVYDDPPDPQP